MPTTTVQPYHGSYLMPSLEHATVADAMHPGILTCEADGTLTDVAETAGALARHTMISVEPTMPLRAAGELMLSRGVTHVAVVDPAVQRPTGILSTLDIAGVLAWGEA